MRSPIQRPAVAGVVLLACAAWCAPGFAQTSGGWGYTDLGALDGSFIGPVSPASSGLGIGKAFTAGGSTGSFSYSGSSISDLGAVNGTSGGSFYVNAAGQVAGQSYAGSGASTQAFFYANGKFNTIGSLGGSSSSATAINAAGVVIGNSTLSGNAARHAFEYVGGSMIDIGTFGGTNSTAVAVNSAGAVIGNATTAGNGATHAFIFADGKLTDLGTLGGTNSYALGMDSFGDVIGLSNIAGSSVQHSFLWSDGVMTDLSNIVPGATNFVASGINDAMQLIGTASTKAGLVHGLLVSAVPETEGFAMALAGFALLAAACRRRR